MRKYLVLLLFVVLGFDSWIYAQEAEAAFKRANQQYVLFESERDKGDNPNAMYNYLLESYQAFKEVVDTQNNTQYLTGTKNRLRSIYPYLVNAAVYYSEQKQPSRALDFAGPYIEIPQMSIFRSELLQRDSRYASIVYYAAAAAYQLEKYPQSIRYFREYLVVTNANVDDPLVKDCYVYMNMAYQKQKNYVEQEKILEQAIAKYPVSLDFLYNLVNVHIATNNIPKLLATIDRILEIDPNNTQVLPIKARILERQGQNKEAIDIYKRLYALHPDSYEIQTGLARANFNVATEIVNSGLKVTNDAEYALIRQRAATYLMDAKDLFLKILEKEPTSQMYMQGLAGVYQYMDMKPEYEVLSKIIAEGGSYISFPAKLTAYNEEHKQASAAQPEMADATPVPVEPAMLVIRVDSFIDGNNNRVIDAGESFAIQFTIENRGKGDAYDLRIRLSEQQGYDQIYQCREASFRIR